ncbi:MAG: prolyl oligopeptidase family serine peptidase [Planctomycetota bacterium]|nr:prolyl oligopeptidase family serine peptidase [Planctomycetota bacterium]
MPNSNVKRSTHQWLILCFTTFCGLGLVPASAKDVEGDPLHAQIESLARRLDTLEQNTQVDRDQLADARIFLKGAIWARDGKLDRDATTQTLIEQAVRRATERVNALQSAVTDGKRPAWCNAHGKLLRGFESDVDGSTQPYGLSIPAGYDPAKPIRLDVVLHGSHGGRASPTGDLQFINAYDAGELGTYPPDLDYIELFPMGRLGENAYRFEGETDVFEAIEAVCRNYSVDRNRIVLRGSSLGGVGSWQIGLKRPDLFLAVGPTAGPVDTI